MDLNVEDEKTVLFLTFEYSLKSAESSSLKILDTHKFVAVYVTPLLSVIYSRKIIPKHTDNAEYEVISTRRSSVGMGVGKNRA